MTRCEIPIFNLIFNFYSDGNNSILGFYYNQNTLAPNFKHVVLNRNATSVIKSTTIYLYKRTFWLCFKPDNASHFSDFKSHQKLIIKRNKAKLKKQKQKNKSKNIICSIFSFFTLSGIIFLRWRLQVRMCPCLS